MIPEQQAQETWQRPPSRHLDRFESRPTPERQQRQLEQISQVLAMKYSPEAAPGLDEAFFNFVKDLLVQRIRFAAQLVLADLDFEQFIRNLRSRNRFYGSGNFEQQCELFVRLVFGTGEHANAELQMQLENYMHYYYEAQLKSLLGELVRLDPERFAGEIDPEVWQRLVAKYGLQQRLFRAGEEIMNYDFLTLAQLVQNGKNRLQTLSTAEKIAPQFLEREQVEQANLEKLLQALESPDQVSVGTAYVEFSEPIYEHQSELMLRIHVLRQGAAGNRYWQTTQLQLPHELSEQIFHNFRQLNRLDYAIHEQQVQDLDPRNAKLALMQQVALNPAPSDDPDASIAALANRVLANTDLSWELLNQNDDIVKKKLRVVANAFERPGTSVLIAGQDIIAAARSVQKAVDAEILLAMSDKQLREAGATAEDIVALRRGHEDIASVITGSNIQVERRSDCVGGTIGGGGAHPPGMMTEQVYVPDFGWVTTAYEGGNWICPKCGTKTDTCLVDPQAHSLCRSCGLNLSNLKRAYQQPERKQEFIERAFHESDNLHRADNLKAAEQGGSLLIDVLLQLFSFGLYRPRES